MTARIRTLALMPATALALALAPAAMADTDQESPVTVEQIENRQFNGGDINDLLPDATVSEVFDPSIRDFPADVEARLPRPSAAGGNASRVVQDGSANVSVLRAFGSGNRTAQLQDGSDNRSRITVIGNDNAALTEQMNSFNNAAITIDRSDGSGIAVFQEGGNAVGISHSGAPKGIVVRQSN